jgi:hypothetical protein
MKIVTGKVVHGRIDVPEDVLTEGSVVTMLVSEEEEGFELSPELEDELVEAMAEADRGETVDGWELLRDLKGSRTPPPGVGP